jgi:hypothetical protein
MAALGKEMIKMVRKEENKYGSYLCKGVIS